MVTKPSMSYRAQVQREYARWVASDLRNIILTLEGASKWANKADAKRLAAIGRELETMAADYQAKANVN